MFRSRACLVEVCLESRLRGRSRSFLSIVDLKPNRHLLDELRDRSQRSINDRKEE
uniref:Uncharacterized protein n=1 Tax=Utricularia reniformis TaxID=192314 RepID=A0A1Y0B331_9LAMI|nr:hypothetical protein AEK19_MT1636 [Utricularia reniformis]ART31820.1 hypothetical protein AEK19_MT1636 [Utricularia reniformis]